MNTCPVCKKIHQEFRDSVFPKESEIKKFCPDCKVDEAMHAYLRSLRQKQEKLSLFERLFLFVQG